MIADLEKMNRSALEKLKSSVEETLEKLAEQDKKAAFVAAEKAVAAYGFSLAEIARDTVTAQMQKTKSGPKTVSPPKYCNPDDNDQTWTGKGRQPEWFKSAIAQGKTPDMMEI